MTRIKQDKDRFVFIDIIQEWFLQRRTFWGLISLLTFFSLTIILIFFTFTIGINTEARQEIDSLVIPILTLFVFSIFWRGFLSTFLSFAGALTTYYGIAHLYLQSVSHNALPLIAERIVQSKINVSINSLDIPYFFVGILSLVLCMTIAFRPSFFRAKGRENSLPYPFWTSEESLKMRGSSQVALISVATLLSYEERHLVTKYRFIAVMIGEKIYYVYPDDLVPTGTSVVRDKKSGLLLGIPRFEGLSW